MGATEEAIQRAIDEMTSRIRAFDPEKMLADWATEFQKAARDLEARRGGEDKLKIAEVAAKLALTQAEAGRMFLVTTMSFAIASGLLNREDGELNVTTTNERMPYGWTQSLVVCRGETWVCTIERTLPDPQGDLGHEPTIIGYRFILAPPLNKEKN